MTNGVYGSFRKFSITVFVAVSVFCAFAFCTVSKLCAQTGARIYYIEGEDFELTLRNERTIFPAEAAGEGGINLERSGIVHTGPGTFLEMQLIPSGTVVKLSENSSLVYNGIDETGRFEDLGLLYGRMRVVTGSGASSVVVRSGVVSARLGRGDFGVDYLLEPGELNSAPRPLFNIHVIKGNTEVFPYGMGSGSTVFGVGNSLDVYEGEGLFLDISSFHTFAEKKSLGYDVLRFWNDHNFAGSPPLAMPDTQIAVGEPPSDAPAASSTVISSTVIPSPDSPATVYPSAESLPEASPSAPIEYTPPEPIRTPVAASNRGKNITLALGLFLTASSVALQVVSNPQFDLFNNKDLAKNLNNVSYVSLGAGLITTLVAILYNPSR